MTRRPLLYALTSVLCFLAASPVQAETVRDAVAAALATHPAVDIAKSRVQSADEDESVVYSDLFPQVNMSATGGRMFGNNSTTRGLTVSRGEAYSWLWEGNASITQPIFDGFQTYNRIDAARAREGVAELTLADAREGLALRAAQSFLNVMRAQEAHAKAVSYQDRIKSYLSRINGMVEAGAADAAEEAQARNIQAQLETSVVEMDGQVKLALADYAEVTGAVPSGELRATDDAKSLMFASAGEAIEHANQYHPIILSARKSVEAEDGEISAEKGALLPSLAGEMSYLKRDQKEEIGGEVVDGRAVMRMNWGFSTGGAQLARIRKAKSERSEALARTAQAQREIERDIRKAYAEYDTAGKQKDIISRRVGVTKELFQTYENQFEASRVRLLQLMQAENQVFSTELEQINAHYRLLMAEYSTLASAGRLLSALNVDADNLPTQPSAQAAWVAETTPEPAAVAESGAAADGSVYPLADYKPAQSAKGE